MIMLTNRKVLDKIVQLLYTSIEMKYIVLDYFHQEEDMSTNRKLKPDRNITGVLLPLSMLIVFGVVTLVSGLSVGLLSLAIMLWVIALFYGYAFLRTRNVAQMVICADVVYFGFMVLIFDTRFYTDSALRVEYGLAYGFGLMFFGFVIAYLAVTRRLKWRGRETFELAAAPVNEVGNGYTSRPKPVGKVNYSREQIYAFARFAARNLIALPYITPRGVTLVPVKMGDEFGRLLGLSGDYHDATWINFDDDGEVTVHIAQKDYLDYREALTFDPLCTSLGQVFIDFLEMHNKGESVRVIDRLDDLKIAFFS